jgi:hypothetical protein
LLLMGEKFVMPAVGVTDSNGNATAAWFVR